MRRIELPEIHDHRRFPGFLRDLVTDALQALWQFGNSYRPILPVLYQGLAAGTKQDGRMDGDCVEILDLCSGGSGPWLRLAPELARGYGLRLQVRLTDKYPNHSAFAEASDRSLAAGASVRIDAVTESVDATYVPPHLTGFRTIFSSFHHFGPKLASTVLLRAVEDGQGIGIFEVARRGPRTMLTLCITPFLLLILTPGIRPFRWSRLLWTYLIPVVPFVIWYDGIVSCLRAYSLEELREMVKASAAGSRQGYTWKVGETQTGLLPVTYLIAYPAVQSAEPQPEEMAAEPRPIEALS